jgi:hypothetical protein
MAWALFLLKILIVKKETITVVVQKKFVRILQRKKYVEFLSTKALMNCKT